ncbi:MAG: GH3 auxin-responsive promoter family protein, partial [Caldilineales bacterium]|nr:GH3 auxin-responsive promoter family protein [Caldilineales bacterium]
IEIPQMVFWSRADDIIDIAGFCRLTEKSIWGAIEAADIGCKDWVARKEFMDRAPYLALYLELLDEASDLTAIKQRIHANLREADPAYGELEDMLGLEPLQVKQLSTGTFQRYLEDRQAAGAELAHLKPAHMRPSDEVMERLMALGKMEVPAQN